MMLSLNNDDNDDDTQEKDCTHVNTMKNLELHLKRRYTRHCTEKVLRNGKWREETFCLRKTN